MCHHANYLRLSVTDKETVGTFEVGHCLIDLRKLMDGKKVTNDYTQLGLHHSRQVRVVARPSKCIT